MEAADDVLAVLTHWQLGDVSAIHKSPMGTMNDIFVVRTSDGPVVLRCTTVRREGVPDNPWGTADLPTSAEKAALLQRLLTAVQERREVTEVDRWAEERLRSRLAWLEALASPSQ